MKNKKQAIILIIMAGFFFALMSFFVRRAGDLPTFQKAFFRNLVAAVVSLVLLLRSKQGFQAIGKRNYLTLFLRVLFGTLGILFNFYAIDHLYISDANILNKLSPFFAIIMSYFILNEKATKQEWIAVVVAFAGALFIIKPAFNSEVLNAFIGVLGGFCAGTAYTFVRKLGQNGVKKSAIVFAFSAFSCLSLLPFVLMKPAAMTGTQIFMLLLAGLSATGGQFSITAAYSKASAKEISVFDYSQVVFAAVLGILFLGQVPDLYSIIGYIIIISMAVYKWHHSLHKAG